MEWESALELGRKSHLLHSIPTLGPDETRGLHDLIQALEPVRVVYISSTGVYGAEQNVDETTPAAANEPKGQQRLAEEAWITAGPWTSVILRSGAIYGPGRGVHVAVKEGRTPRTADSGLVSRIHVDDLAALADAALFSDLVGVWPVADDLPCSSAEIVAWLSGGETLPASDIVIKGRSVNGRKIRELLGVKLRYPSWRTGVPAALREEGSES